MKEFFCNCLNCRKKFFTPVESKIISASEADQLLRTWARLSLRVCLAICLGELAWHAHWVGTIANGRSGGWVHTSGNTTNMLSTDQYNETMLTEDDELVGMRFRKPNGSAATDFEVDLFIARNDGWDERAVHFFNRFIH